MTKKAFKRQLHKTYPWFDYTYLLEMMEVWLSHASERHRAVGICANSESYARDLAIAAELCKRLRDDGDSCHEMAANCVLMSKKIEIEMKRSPSEKKGCTKVEFTGVDQFGNEVSREELTRNTKLVHKREDRQRKELLEMLTNLMKRKLLTWWD